MARKESTYRGRSKSEVLAELTAMHAAGDISAEELKAAREKVLLGDGDEPRSVVRERVVEVDRKKKGGCGSALIGLVVIVGIVAAIGTMSKPGSSSSTASPVDAAKTAEDHRKGFHCLSAWDGSNQGLVAAVKENMREPSSFEHVETKITPVDEKGRHTVFMTYRGRNGFGGMNVENAIGVISNSTCALISFTAG